MSIFRDVELIWQGKTYPVKAENVMRLIAKVEDVCSLVDLHGVPKLAKVSAGYAEALRFAGCEVTDEEVYAAIFSSGNEMSKVLGELVTGLLMMMVPPPDLMDDPDAKKPAQPQKQPGGHSSSKRPTKPR